MNFLRKTSTPKTTHLKDLTEARLRLIEEEQRQLKELHEILMEEARYRKEAAKFVFSETPGKVKNYEQAIEIKDDKLFNAPSYPIAFIHRKEVRDQIQEMRHHKTRKY